MKKYLLISLALLVSTLLPAETFSKVKCSANNDGKVEWVQLKVGNRGMLQWEENRWAKASKKAEYLGAFAENTEEYGFEWEKTFKAGNGYSILELGTTADSFTIGVNLRDGKGFFRYKDLGSGAGDQNWILSCEAM